MDKGAIIAKISCTNGYDEFCDWVCGERGPTGIEPQELHDHILGEVMETLLFLELNDRTEELDSNGVRRFIIREIEYYEKYGRIRHSC